LAKLEALKLDFEDFEVISRVKGSETMAREFLCLLLLSRARKLVFSPESCDVQSLKYLLENLKNNPISSPELLAVTELILSQVN